MIVFEKHEYITDPSISRYCFELEIERYYPADIPEEDAWNMAYREIISKYPSISQFNWYKQEVFEYSGCKFYMYHFWIDLKTEETGIEATPNYLSYLIKTKWPDLYDTLSDSLFLDKCTNRWLNYRRI